MFFRDNFESGNPLRTAATFFLNSENEPPSTDMIQTFDSFLSRRFVFEKTYNFIPDCMHPPPFGVKFIFFILMKVPSCRRVNLHR